MWPAKLARGFDLNLSCADGVGVQVTLAPIPEGVLKAFGQVFH